MSRVPNDRYGSFATGSSPATSPAMSAMPPKAEVYSEHWRLRDGPLRVDGTAIRIWLQMSPRPRHPPTGIQISVSPRRRVLRQGLRFLSSFLRCALPAGAGNGKADSRYALKLADHGKQLFARGFPLGPNMRIKLLDGVPVAFASFSNPTVALI
jgi:hypothetical protein